MANEELVRRLLKELEAEKKGPVQLRADTPASEDNLLEDGREYFGRFWKRPVTVTLVEGLGRKHQRKQKDLEQFCGDHSSLSDLYNKVDQFNKEYLQKHKSHFLPKYDVSAQGIFADPVQVGFGLKFGYKTKVADISLKLIE